VGAALRKNGLEEVQRFSRLCSAFLTDGSEINIGTVPGVCGYSITQEDVRLTVLDPALEEEFMETARQFRKPGTLVREVKSGKITITFRIRRG